MPSEFVDGGNRITVDILDRDQTRVGPGPLQTCLDLTCEALLNQAGTFEARFPANDPRLAYLQLKRHLLAFYVDGELVHAGIAESDGHEISDDGQRILVVRGRDMLAELDETTLGFTQFLDEGNPSSNAPWTLINTYNSDNGYSQLTDAEAWRLTKEVSEDDDFPITETLIYGAFAGESALKGLTRIAEHTGEAFRLALKGNVREIAFIDPNPVRHVEWLGTNQLASGVRAVQGVGDAVDAEGNAHICYIQRLTARRDASRLLTKIHPYGTGFGETRLDLAGTNRDAPSGFTLDEDANTISSNAAETYIGKALHKHVNFKDIRPLFNTDADIEFAKDYLFDAALAYLQRNDDPDDTLEYDLEVAALPGHVKVGTTLRVIYQDEDYSLDVDLIILGIRRNMDSAGASTFRLTVSHSNQWRLSESSAIVAQMEEGEIFAAHPQIDANSYWENFREEVGDDMTNHIAEFPFVLSAEVVTIRQVLFRYSVGRILTGTYSYAYASANTDQNAAANTGDTAVTTDATSVGIDSTAVTTNSTSVAIDSTSVTTHTTSVGIDSTTVTVNPLSGGAVSSAESTSTDSTSPDSFTDTNYLGMATATQGALSANPSNHSHDIGTHIHDFTHSHTTANHSHIIDHGHSTVAHSHTNTAHLHTSDAHSHTNTAHLHTSTAHSHTNTAHLHTSTAHHHTSPQHVHAAPDLVETFVLNRVPVIDSYVMADLEYSVNGGPWFELDTGIPVAGGYYELDITSSIQNPNGLRRPYQEDNLVQIRRKSSTGTGKSALIRAKLGIRATVQSIVTYA